MSKTSAIIVSYNSASSLKNALEHCRQAEINSIAVVDNDSSDQSVDIAKQYADHVIKNKENKGFGAAANQGADLVGDEWLLFLNPDTEIEKSSIKKAETYGTLHPHVGIIGLGLIDSLTKKPEMYSFGNFPTLLNLLVRKITSSPLTNQPIEVDWVSGAALMIKRSLWEELNGFDPSFFMYWEDIDLCYRAYGAGYKTVLLPHATCMHVRGASLSDKKAKTAVYDASADRYFKKHYPTFIWVIQHYLRHIYRWLSPLSH